MTGGSSASYSSDEARRRFIGSLYSEDSMVSKTYFLVVSENGLSPWISD